MNCSVVGEGDLRKALTLEGSERITWWNKGKQIACDMARGLAFLHSNKIIHRESLSTLEKYSMLLLEYLW